MLAFTVISSTGTPAEWEALLEEFRLLGGIAENVVLRQGPRGRGVFPIDPAQPIRLHVPANLLAPLDDLELRDGCLVAKESGGLGARERLFFNRYQRELFRGAGVFADLWADQLAWSRLPQQVQDTLREIGWIADLSNRFSPPSDALCARLYLANYKIHYENRVVVMPMVELINHSGGASGYAFDNGVAVAGRFEGEVLVKYNADDCWGRALMHGFCDPAQHALSLAFRYQCEDLRIEIRRDYAKYSRANGVVAPVVRLEQDGTVHFSYLMLGHVRYPHLPRSHFLHITKDTPVKRPDELFDLIQHHNRLQFFKFLRASENPATPLVAMLRAAAYQQLTTLSTYWGTVKLGS